MFQFKQAMEKCGYKIKQIPFSDWIQAVKKDTSSPLYLLFNLLLVKQ